MFQSPGAILIRIGPLAIRWYAVMIATGFLCCGFTASRLAKRWGIDPDEMFNCAVVCFISGILGARLYYVALSWSHFSSNLSEIFAIWNGGLSIHGGIIGGTIAGVIYCWRHKLPTLTVADIVGATIPIAQAIGRWGNFFNSEAFGRPVPDYFPLKLYIPPENRPPKFEGREF